MTKDKIWIPLLIATLVMLTATAYAMISGWPQRIISPMGIVCFILTGATILTHNLRW